MDKQTVEQIVYKSIEGYFLSRNIEININKDTPLIGSQSILDSLSLVSLIVDIEASFLDEDIEITLTSETAMSSRISPFRSVGALNSFIAKQLGVENDG